MKNIMQSAAAICLGCFFFGALTPVTALEKIAEVRIGRVSQPPVIDGKLDDPCWSNTVEIAPFILLKQKEFAREQTRAYIAYDEQNLYVAFRCEASCLDPANNQLAEFKTGAGRDSDQIFNNDCVLVLLCPDEKRNDVYYEIGVNGAGIVNDAKCVAPNYWGEGARDKAWNYGGQVAVKTYSDTWGGDRGKAYWVVEFSVPLAAFGPMPRPGTTWRVCLGRLEQRDHERSVWQPMEEGFHIAPDSFGRIVFDNAVPGVRNVAVGNFSFGENRMTCDLVSMPAQAGMRLETAVMFAGQGKDVAFRDLAPGKTGKMEHVYELKQAGPFEFQYRMLNPASMATYYQSPLYAAHVSMSLLTGSLRADGDYTLYLNGKEVLKGGKGEQKFSVALLSGINALALEANGPVTGDFAVGDFTFKTDNRWKYSPAAADGWTTNEFNDSAWKTTEAKEATLGAPGSKSYFRKIILHGHSAFWPNWAAEALSIAENSVQMLSLFPQGLKKKTFTDWQVNFEVPAEFRVTGASGYYGVSHKRKGFRCEERGTTVRNGQEYRRYAIRALDPVSFREKFEGYQMCAIAVELPVSGKRVAERECVFYYSMEAENGAIQEVPREMPVKILPPLRGKQPKKYAWQTTTAGSVMDDLNCLDTLTASLARAGFNQLWHGRNPEPQKKLPAKNVAMFGFASWQVNCHPYLEKHPEEARIDKDGNRCHEKVSGRKTQICPGLLVRDTPAWEFVASAIIAWIKKDRIDQLDWDYEYSVWDDKTEIVCFCPRCLADFKEMSKIPADTQLNYGVIKEKYPEQWIRFMNQRMAQICGKVRQAVHKVGPDKVFSVYSGYQCDFTREGYGVDWAMLADKIDLAICGYGRSVPQIADTLKVLGNVPLACGDCITPYRTDDRTFPTYCSKAIILRRAVDGTGGFLAWHYPDMDGKSFYASAEISRLVADYEDLFVAHRKDNALVTAEGIGADDVTVFTDGKRRLVLLINEKKDPKKVLLKNNQFTPQMKVFDYYAEKDLGNLREITTEVPANDVKAFIIEEQENWFHKKMRTIRALFR